MCYVRKNEGGKMVLTTWGRSSGFCIDPIEKKPLNHFFPGSSVLSFGTAGCNLGCRFCQNWDISKAREIDRLQDSATPAEIARRAVQLGCRSVAFTYNDPVIFAEYALDVADACHALGVHTVAVTAGYIQPEPRREFYAQMDAANIDLKGFTEDFYTRLTLSHLKPVLETLEYVQHHTRTWLEITTLLIPGYNDGDEELQALSRWVHEHLGPDVPVHFTAFHPDYKLTDVAPTRKATLRRARALALAEGLRFVYTGNVHDREGDATVCPECGAMLIARDWYEILDYQLRPDGCCPGCGERLPGVFAAQAEHFGSRRVPVVLGARERRP